MISDTIVYDIFSFHDGILIKHLDGIEVLHSFLSRFTLCRRIFKNEGGYFKFLHTNNVAFLVSELTNEQSSHILFKKNHLKNDEICHRT